MKRLGTLRRLIISLFCILAISFGLYVASIRLFTITTIEVMGARMNFILNEKSFVRNLLIFPSEKVRVQLLHDNPTIKDIQIHKKFPHTLIISAYPRTAIARLEVSSQQVALDKDGMVLDYIDPTDTRLTKLDFDIPNAAIGLTVNDQRILDSLTLLSFMGDSMQIQVIDEPDNLSIRARTGQLDILLPQHTPILDKMATLQTIISGFRIKGNLPKMIDLRYDKPIVTF